MEYRKGNAILEGKGIPEPAAAALYDRYSTGLYRYAFRLLGDSSAAEDCVSETFSRLLKALREGRGPKDYPQAYLYRIAHNWITDRFRRSPPAELPLDAVPAPAEDSTGAEAEEIIRRRQLRVALRRLTPDQRQAIVLRFLEGLDNAEVAQSMERPIGSVKALQQRGIASLRRLLAGEENPDA
jgi:RNA polymerase sigma-70 factor (ECF subfamily)